MIRKHEPVSEKEMNWSSPQNTICETIRRAYHMFKDGVVIEPDSVADKALRELRIATSMAKSMSNKLEEYSRNWKNGFWERNQNFPIRYHQKPIDVLFICWDDNANTMYRFWQCAKYLGLNSVMFKGRPHAFGYPFQAPIHPSLTSTPIAVSPTTVMAPGLESLINSAHVIHLGASTYPMCAVNWAKKNVIVQHGGTVYRQNPKACNDLFNQFAAKTVIQTPDLLGLGAKNESLIYFPVDTVNIKPDFYDNGTRPIIGHFPSNPEVKGTALIEKVLDEIKSEKYYDFIYAGSTNRTTWSENLSRMSKCDIIIDGCNPEQKGKKYGAWGNVTLEASALGCAVITHDSNWSKYKDEYGIFGPIIANNADELKGSLKDLMAWHEIRKVKKRCREWVKQNHSIPVTANRLWDLIYKEYFV